MHNPNQPKEKANPLFFIPIVAIAAYIIYSIVVFAFNYGSEVGTVKATYRGPIKEEADASAQVFNHARLIKPTEELIDLGSKVYKNNCTSCHGPEGLGNGASGANLAVKPRNFHEDLSAWKNGASVITMYGTLDVGLGSMPNFPALNPEQRYAVIHYIHAELMGGNFPEDTAEAIASLPEPSAGGGGVQIDPYLEQRIPVNFAMEKMLKESRQ